MIVVWMMWEGFGIKKGYTLFDGRSEIKMIKISLLFKNPLKLMDGTTYILYMEGIIWGKSKDNVVEVNEGQIVGEEFY